jgi:hypothetical protein
MAALERPPLDGTLNRKPAQVNAESEYRRDVQIGNKTMLSAASDAPITAPAATSVG